MQVTVLSSKQANEWKSPCRQFPLYNSVRPLIIDNKLTLTVFFKDGLLRFDFKSARIKFDEWIHENAALSREGNCAFHRLGICLVNDELVQRKLLERHRFDTSQVVAAFLHRHLVIQFNEAALALKVGVDVVLFLANTLCFDD